MAYEPTLVTASPGDSPRAREGTHEFRWGSGTQLGDCTGSSARRFRRVLRAAAHSSPSGDNGDAWAAILARLVDSDTSPIRLTFKQTLFQNYG
jgi:hypothetical protein